MNKVRLLTLLCFFSISIVFLPKAFTLAEPDCNSNNLRGADIDVCLAKMQHDADALAPANENNKKELANLQAQIVSLKAKIVNITKQVNSLSTQITKRSGDLSYAQKIFNEKANNQYKILRLYDPLSAFLENESAKNVFLQLEMRQRAVDGDRVTMENYSKDLSSLASDKASLEKSKVSLANLQASVDKRAIFLSSEVAKVDDYLAKLSSRQEELLALKAGGFETSVGDTPPTLDPCSGAPGTSSFCDPGFRPAFAGFSFGAPHRTGMSQYGALGRSKSGQNAETILSAYYQGSSLRKDYPDTTIGVTGYGRKPIEEYLLGLYEVPESWGDQGGFEALKAQAVAARSYALAVTNNGAGTICTTEACQVYKPQLKSGKWAEAVRATKGWVLIKDGGPAKAYFAASSGGYTISQWGWSGIKDAAGDWPATAYEKVGGSPWFYKGWFRSRSGATCGLGNPWLTSSQMADILNAWHVLFNGGGDQGRISPPDKCFGGNPYSTGELSSIGGYTSVSNVSVVYSNDGYTKQVTFQTNKGSVTINGDDLKKAFNLRAPGNVGIKSSLYNIEKL